MMQKWKIKKMIICFIVGFVSLSMTSFYSVNVFAKNNKEANIYIDTDSIITKNFEGFGVQWDPSDLFDYTDEQWDSFYEKAGFLKPNIMRVMLHDGDSYVTGFDEAGNPIYDWDSVMMKRVYKILDFAQKNNIPIMLGEWRSISERGILSYDEVGKTVKWDNSIWQTMIVDCLKHLIVDKGYTCIQYYNMVNEPNYYVRDNGGTDQQSYDMWKKGIIQLREKMDHSGIEQIQKIKIVGPDVYDKQEAWIKQAKSDELKEIVELTEIHRYAPKSEVESGLIETKLKNWKAVAEEMDPNVKEEGFALGEMGLSGTGPGDSQLNARYYDYGVDIFDYALQATRAGLKFGSVWGFEDSMHVQHNDIVNSFADQYGPLAKTEEGRSYQVHTPTGDPSIDNDIKIWGFWNELGEEMAKQNAQAGVTNRANTVKASDEQLKPWYYTWSMLCRYFPSGMQILDTTDSGVEQVRATSGMIRRENNQADLSIAVVNTTNKEQKVHIQIPNVKGTADLNQYFYYDGEINGRSRTMNDKGQLLPYDIMKDVSLSQGTEVTLPANSCMLLTTLGYERESHPVDLMTGKTVDATEIEIYEEGFHDKLTVGQTYQMKYHLTPSIAKDQVEWKVTDYFGKVSDLASIDAHGQLTVHKAGSFKVIGNIKNKPEISSSSTFIATTTKILVDDLENLDVAEYEYLIRDDNSANFNNKKTIKRSDSQANGKPGVITYHTDHIFDFELNAYSLHDDLENSHNFEVALSTDGKQWTHISCYFEKKDKLSSSWYPYTITPKEIDISQNYQYLKITLKSQNGYKTYDPQYAGGTISYGEQSASEIQIDNSERFVVNHQTLQFHASVLPDSVSQDISYSVVETDGTPSIKASIDENGLLTAKEIGDIVVILQTKDQSLSAYYPLKIVGGHIVDEINNFDLMYDHGSFTYEKDLKKFGEETLIKRTSDTPQSIVYAYDDLQEVTFEVFSNSTFSKDQASIYMSQDGDHYDEIDITIKKIGNAPGASDFSKYSVTAIPDQGQYNFVKFEIKNDEKIYNPMIAKAEIIYNQVNDQASHINIVEDCITINKGQQISLDVKTAPMTAQKSLSFESQNSQIATINTQGIITAKTTGSTYVTVRLNQNECMTIPVYVLEENIAFQKNVEVSSEYNQTDKKASLAVDGDYSTRWGSEYTDKKNESIIVDLGTVQTIDTVKIFWEAARAKDYNIEVAQENQQFKIVKELRDQTTGTNDIIQFDALEARYVKINGLKPIGKYGYSIYELEVYNNSDIVHVQDVQFSKDSYELYVGQEENLSLHVVPSQATYSLAVYQSSDENILKIKNGKMIALKEGKVTLNAEVDGKTASIPVNIVKENVQKIADEMKILHIQNGKIQFPQYEQYHFSIFSSNHDNIIDLDGQVHIPVYDTIVQVVIEVKDKNGKKAYTQPIALRIGGHNESYITLQAFIKELKSIDETIYKSSSMKDFKKCLQEVEQILKTSDLLVDDVQEAYYLLNDAYQHLQLKEDTTALYRLIDEIKALDSQLYTKNSYQKLLEKLDQIEQQIHDDSTKEDIAYAVEQLSQAYKQLVKQRDYDLLKNKIQDIENMELGIYTKQSQKQLLNHLQKAKDYLRGSQITTKGIYQHYDQLVTDCNQLTFIGNKDSLKTLINKIEKIDLSKYQSEEVEYLKSLIKNIQQKLDNDLTEEECLELMIQLQNAYSELQPMEKKLQSSKEIHTDDTTVYSTYILLGILSLGGIYILLRKYSKY